MMMSVKYFTSVNFQMYVKTNLLFVWPIHQPQPPLCMGFIALYATSSDIFHVWYLDASAPLRKLMVSIGTRMQSWALVCALQAIWKSKVVLFVCRLKRAGWHDSYQRPKSVYLSLCCFEFDYFLSSTLQKESTKFLKLCIFWLCAIKRDRYFLSL